MNSTKDSARVAGLLYLLVAITGAFSIMYIPAVFVVPGDATATASKIKASELLFRIGIVSELFSIILFVFLVVALYHLLKGIDKKLALLMLILALVSAPASYINVVNRIAPTLLLGGADYLSVFDQHQLEALAMLFLKLHGNGMAAVSLFWGLWLFPFGILVVRSGFIPRILGVLLFVAGIAYLTGFLTALLLPGHSHTVSQFLLPLEAGELPIIFWLLIKGARVQPLKGA